MELLINFDRNDRLYRIGEQISGVVLVEVDNDITYSEIWITYRWRTHGKGNRDQGAEEKLTLAEEKTSFKARERREFPFRFAAPNGPVTYHGNLLNVDWYLTAQARSGPHGRFKSEQDFLLQAGDPTDGVVLGTKEIPRADLPARSTGVPPASFGLLEVKPVSLRPRGLRSKARYWLGIFGPLCAALLVYIYLMVVDWNFSYIVLAFAVFLVFLAVATALFQNAFRRVLKLGEVWVKPTNVYGGSQVYCHVDFVARRGFHLRSIKASISARERINRTAGTATVTEYHVLDEKTSTRPFEEDLSEGRWIAFDCALPVGVDAPASFTSANNALEWFVTMKAEIARWPSWQKTFPITVLP